MFTVLLVWIWLAACLFVVACVWRAVKYATAPVHLRWDLYPVAHEPGRDHGGSYLEEKDWWTKPRKKSHFGEAQVMAEEILADHPDRFRAFIVESGNPVHSVADSPKMREAMAALMDESYRDEAGRVVFSYAHPIFWAPFTLVGDGGGE